MRAEEVAGLLVAAILGSSLLIALVSPAIGFYPSLKVEGAWTVAWGKGKLLASYEKNMTEVQELRVRAELSAGNLRVEEAEESLAYRVEVYGALMPWSSTDYSVVEEGGRLEVEVKAGSVVVYLNPSILREIEVKVSAGSGTVELGGLNRTVFSFRVSAGSLEGTLEYSNATSSLNIDVSAGGVELRIKVPKESKVYIKASADAAEVDVNVKELAKTSVSGFEERVIADPGFREGLVIDVQASAASVDLKVDR